MRNVPDSRFLFKRTGSENWYVRSVNPATGKYIERSLGTPDKHAATLAAADDIKVHKVIMFQRRQARVASVVHGPWQHEFTPGLHTLPDGRTLIATERDLTFSDGTRRPNGGPAIYVTGGRGGRNGVPSSYPGFTADESATLEFQIGDGIIPPGPLPTKRPSVAVKNASPDDALLETYIAHGAVKTQTPLPPAKAREARKLFETFKAVVGKPLAKCTRDDGRALVAYLEGEHMKEHGKPMKAATLRRYLVPLIATVNLAIAENKLSGPNPFVSIVTKRDDNGSVERDSFTDADMVLIRENEHKLRDQDRLLLRLLATTGIRRGEAFQIGTEGHKEREEDGIRFCIVASRKGNGAELKYRRIPFPADLLPLLPAKITGPLFKGHPGDAVKRLGKFLADIGVICDDGRTLAAAHSFRHRAKNRLRLATPDNELRDAIGGWEAGSKNKGHNYGVKASEGFKGYPMPVLKETIDGIGF